MNPEAIPPAPEVVFRRASRIVSFQGYDFDAEQVVAVGPVVCLDPTAQHWPYGVKVHIGGREISIVLSSRQRNRGYNLANLTHGELAEAAAKRRKELLEVIWPRLARLTSSNPDAEMVDKRCPRCHVSFVYHSPSGQYVCFKCLQPYVATPDNQPESAA